MPLAPAIHDYTGLRDLLPTVSPICHPGSLFLLPYLLAHILPFPLLPVSSISRLPVPSRHADIGRARHPATTPGNSHGHSPLRAARDRRGDKERPDSRSLEVSRAFSAALSRRKASGSTDAERSRPGPSAMSLMLSMLTLERSGDGCGSLDGLRERERERRGESKGGREG